MKFFVLCAAVFCMAIPWLCDALADDDKQYMFKLAHRCKNKTGATEEDIQHLAAKDIPIARSTKCLYACMQELFGMITKEGKFEPEALRDIAKLMYQSNPIIKEALMEIAGECAYVEDADKCELASKTIECAINGAKKRNIDYTKIYK